MSAHVQLSPVPHAQPNSRSNMLIMSTPSPLSSNFYNLMRRRHASQFPTISAPSHTSFPMSSTLTTSLTSHYTKHLLMGMIHQVYDMLNALNFGMNGWLQFMRNWKPLKPKVSMKKSPNCQKTKNQYNASGFSTLNITKMAKFPISKGGLLPKGSPKFSGKTSLSHSHLLHIKIPSEQSSTVYSGPP